MLATAFFDGTVGIHSIQSTNEAADAATAAPQQSQGADIFDAPGFARSSTGGTLSLKQPPKWLRRPASSSFGFGGELVTVSNLPSAQGKNQSREIQIRKVVTEQGLVERATHLQAAINDESLKSFAEERVKGVDTATTGGEGWRALLSLFKANSRDELVTLLGFSKEEIAARVAEAVENLKVSSESKLSLESQQEEDDIIDETPRGPIVSFAEPEHQEAPWESSDAGDDSKPPSEVSAGVTSENARDGESTTTVPSLFEDDIGPGTPQFDAGDDFFATVGVAQDDGESQQIRIPHTNYGLDSSVAATIGSGPSSVTSEALKSNTFRIYPADESEVDRLVTKAVVLGDFESAVSLCLSTDRFADAILLAVRGGQELLQRTQKAYFERRTSSLPYLRLFQSIFTNDLSDIVQNADLQEWQEIFVVLCTFASQEEFPGLAEQLGSRLEFQFTIAKSSNDPEIVADAIPYRKNATLTYLAASRLERLVNIWAEELLEEEKGLVAEERSNSYYSAHAHSLQTFVEKVTVFRSATKYKDEDLTQTSSGVDESVKIYKLAPLYDRYFEYANLLSSQGLVKEAVAFLKLTPAGYKGSSSGTDLSAERDRLIAATGGKPVPAQNTPAPSVPATTRAPYAYPTVPAVPVVSTQPAPVPQPTAYPSYQPAVPAVGPYAPAQQQQTTYVPQNYTNAPYNPQVSLTQPPHLRQQPQPAPVIPPPPRATNGATGPPPPPKKDNGGWNDAPSVVGPARTPAALNLNKPAAITSPFPNAAQSPMYSPQGSPYMTQGQASTTLPPPPRPGSVQARVPPPPQGQRTHPGGAYAPQGRPPSRTAGPPGPVAPPNRIMSPPQGHGQPSQRQPTPSQYAPPPPRGAVPGQTPPPGQFGRVPPPGGQPHAQPSHGPNPYVRATPPPPGPYAPGPTSTIPPPHQQQPQQQQPGAYGPPQGIQRGVPIQQQQQPPPPQHVGPPDGPAAPPRAPSTNAPARAPASGPPPPKYRE